jgi:hypothetical protein
VRYNFAVGEALVKGVRVSVANSLANARRDEFVYLDGRGEVLPRWRYLVYEAALMPFTAVSALAGTWVAIAVGAPVLTFAFFAGAFWVGYKAWLTKRVRCGAAMVLAGDYSSAEQLLTPIAESRMAPRSVRGMARQDLGGIAVRRGQPEAALEHVRLARDDLERTPGPWRFINVHAEVHLLARLGRLQEARTRYSVLAQAPTGEYFQLQRMNTDLLLAFYEGSTDRLPEDLFPWARFALETTAAELAVVLLGWAHRTRGDRDLGDHLLVEGRSRIDESLFRTMFPEVWSWLQGNVPAPAE